ncbi:MAG: hypothetical protein K1X64_00085 [Myxococcaceae bacterium]|nr:hypothetical protein [Myxococcaceae bacterium]
MNRLLLTLTLALTSSCGGVDDSVPGELFIALPRDFASYSSWQSFAVNAPSAPADSHTAGERTIYLNHAPPKGSSEYPVGTIVVKVMKEENQTFAMVKRGGGYNSRGATGWEWFELAAATDGTPAIVWRGITPPAGERYHGVAGGACNDCHQGARSNDFVQSEPLQLSRF